MNNNQKLENKVYKAYVNYCEYFGLSGDSKRKFMIDLRKNKLSRSILKESIFASNRIIDNDILKRKIEAQRNGGMYKERV